MLSSAEWRPDQVWYNNTKSKLPCVFRLAPMTKHPVIFLRATKLRHLKQLVDFMYYGKVNEIMGRI